MSQKISCLTKHSDTPIIFKLIGNDFTDRFFEQLKWVKDVYHFFSRNDYMPVVVHEWNNERIKYFESSIKESVNWLNENGYRFPIPLDEIVLENNMTSRHLLNRLHRHFTTSHRSVTHQESIKTWLDGSDYTFEYDPDNYSAFSHAVHNINEKVHEAEQFYRTPQMSTFPPQTECTLTFDSTRPIDPANNPQNKFLVPITEVDYKYFSDEVDAYDVWLPLGEMQGKNYYRCYFDDDEPNHWDIFSNHYFSGSFTFADRKGMKHPDMINYLNKYGIVNGPLTVGIPLGNIIQGKELLKHFDVNDIVEVNIIE